MNRPRVFTGTYTAIVTPFRDGAVAYDELKKFVNFQIKGGVSGIVPVGTTGESPTVTHEEHLEVIRATIEAADGRVPVIAGTGSNSTREAIADYIVKVSPKKAFLVHGDDDAVEWFRHELHERLPETTVIVPIPGEEHVI